MIMSDIGVETSEEICDRLRSKIKERGITDPKEIMELIHEVIGEIMGDDTGLDLTVSPAVIMVRQTSKPQLMPRLICRKMYQMRKTTAAIRNEVRNHLGSTSIPNAIPSFSVKRMWNQFVTLML